MYSLFYLTQPFTFTYPLACQPSLAVSCLGGSLGRHPSCAFPTGRLGRRPRHRHHRFSFSSQLHVAAFPTFFSAQAIYGGPPPAPWLFRHLWPPSSCARPGGGPAIVLLKRNLYHRSNISLCAFHYSELPSHHWS